MNIKRVLTLFTISFLLSANSYAGNVYNVEGVEVSINHFNAQRTRTKAVDSAVKKGFYKMLDDIVLKEYNYKELLKKIDFKKIDLVEKLNIIEENSTGGKYKAKFNILYNKDAVKQVLREQRIPFTQDSMNNVLILAVKEDSSGQRLLFEESNSFKYLISEYLKDTNLIDPILPKGDFQEVTGFSPYKILDAYNQDKILDLAVNYATEKVIVIVLKEKEESYDVQIKFINLDNMNSYNSLVMGQSLTDVTSQVAEKVKELWKKNHLLEFDKPKRFVAMIETKGDLSKFDGIIENLKAISIVSDVNIMEINRNSAIVQTDFYGQPKEFLNATTKAGLRVFQESGNSWYIDYKKEN